MELNITLTPEQLEQKKMLEERLEQLKQKEGLPAEEVRPFVDETLATYAPLAERLGLTQLQSDLQNLSVLYGYPDDYANLKQLRQESEAMCDITFSTFALPIRAMLDATGIRYRLFYRMKSIYSIWRKMRNDHKQFDDVYDLFAARIVYEPGTGNTEYLRQAEEALGRKLDASFMDQEKLDCWRIYTVVTSLYRVHPKRIKDWVTNPKPSGYQALQMTVMGPDCNWVEIQIRSERMDYEAEYGSAAHWKYKEETKAV